MISFLGAGVLLGLSAGFSPGPLMALVLSQTLSHGTKEGVKVAVVPLLTDAPIIALCLLVLTELADFRPLLGVISLFGGLFVLKLAYDNLRTTRLEITAAHSAPQSLTRGVWVNALSPHPYVFWLTVGSPTVLKAWALDAAAPVLFVAGFMGCLVGSKVFLAVVTGKSRHLLSDTAYRRIMRVLGALLAVFALVLLRDAWRLLAALPA